VTSANGAAARRVAVGNVTFGNDLPVALIAGPCQIESRDHALMVAESLARAAGQAGVPFVFKASYDKANRTSLKGVRGVGLDEGLRVLADVRDALGCPVLTDVHDVPQAEAAGEAVDILQIPAFLSRRRSPGRRSQSASRRMTIPTMRRATGRTCCRSTGCRRSSLI